jgi:hypothetical protein
MSVDHVKMNDLERRKRNRLAASAASVTALLEAQASPPARWKSQHSVEQCLPRLSLKI